eukprot:TRINITY_DN61_c0_g2_i11.p1 TRINITY_DN61_c0_g2~~TRINITY_DN61_c0_g2_i11.p1  ORF type:complete len:261 (+),score=66.74 TRINITY_DN61_c0_g2_i11:87-785(+)
MGAYAKSYGDNTSNNEAACIELCKADSDCAGVDYTVQATSNNEAACIEVCKADSECSGVDYTVQAMSNACRLYRADATPRLGNGGSAKRTYCAKPEVPDCAGKTNLSTGLYIRMDKPKLEQKTKLVDDNVDPICECHDLCKEKSADAYMYFTKGKKNPKPICKCYLDIAAANEEGKLKLQIGGKRTTGKNAGWITEAGKNLLAGDNAKETKRRQKERKRGGRRRRNRRRRRN